MAGMDSQARYTVSSESPYACKCIIDIEQSHFNVFFLVSLSFTTTLMSIVLFREVDSLAEQISEIKNQNE